MGRTAALRVPPAVRNPSRVSPLEAAGDAQRESEPMSKIDKQHGFSAVSIADMVCTDPA